MLELASCHTDSSCPHKTSGIKCVVGYCKASKYLATVLYEL